MPGSLLCALYALCLIRHNKPIKMKPMLRMRSGNMFKFTHSKWQEGTLNRGLAPGLCPFRPAVHINRMSRLYMLLRQGLGALTLHQDGIKLFLWLVTQSVLQVSGLSCCLGAFLHHSPPFQKCCQPPSAPCYGHHVLAVIITRQEK